MPSARSAIALGSSVRLPATPSDVDVGESTLSRLFDGVLRPLPLFVRSSRPARESELFSRSRTTVDPRREPARTTSRSWSGTAGDGERAVGGTRIEFGFGGGLVADTGERISGDGRLPSTGGDAAVLRASGDGAR